MATVLETTSSTTRDAVTMAELFAPLGGVPLNRIRVRPTPGTATVSDVVRVHEQHGVLCELIDGILVEKGVGFEESILGCVIIQHLTNFVRPHDLGLIAGPDGMLEIQINLVRIPDVCFINWDRLPGRRAPKNAVPRIVPNLVVEILSRSNTRAEMKRKRRECFLAGVELFWEVDPRKRVVRVYTEPDKALTLTKDETLDWGEVLPGFELPLRDLFAVLDGNS